jgi:hypothetical protein
MESFSQSQRFTGKQGEPKVEKIVDTDLNHDSPHHTLGRGPLQAAPGVHKHTISDVTDLQASLQIRMGSTNLITDALGDVILVVGEWAGAGSALVANGNWATHQRTIEIKTFDPITGIIECTGMIPNTAVKINWIVG